MPPRQLIIAAILGLTTTLTVSAADAPVSLELITEPGFPIDGHQRWIRYLQDFKFTTVRIRSGRAGDESKVENRGTESAPRYAITGLLTANNRLLVPGATFRYGQRAELAAWLQKLRQGGLEALASPTGAFGLTAKQLVALNDALRPKLAISTKGKPTSEVLKHLQRTIRVPLEFDSSGQRALLSNDRVLDELQGLSCGTALVAVLRPHALRVTPTGQGTRSVGLRVTRNAKPEDAWPLGRKATKGAQDVAPGLLKFINVHIVDEPLDETLDVIQSRLEIPFLYDHNSLALNEVDLHDTVSLPPAKWFYKKIIDQLLFQKLLVCELRIDEAGSPFLWITSAKR